jgi:hypothetical protein
MDTALKIDVYRRLDNRWEGLADDSDRALELHKLRRHALHKIFDGNPDIGAIDWGLTDGTASHEVITLTVVPAAVAGFHYIVLPVAAWLAGKLADKAFDAAWDKFVPSLISAIGQKQKEKLILAVDVKLPTGTTIRIDAEGEYGSVLFADKERVTFNPSRESNK